MQQGAEHEWELLASPPAQALLPRVLLCAVLCAQQGVKLQLSSAEDCQDAPEAPGAAQVAFEPEEGKDLKSKAEKVPGLGSAAVSTEPLLLSTRGGNISTGCSFLQLENNCVWLQR